MPASRTGTAAASRGAVARYGRAVARLLADTDERTLRRTDDGHEVAVVDSVHAVGRRAWNEVVERSPRASVFHRFEWLDAVESGTSYAPRHLVVSKDGNTIGVCPQFARPVPNTPFRRLSASYPGYGGPLVPTDTRRSLELVVDAASMLSGGRTVAHEIRALDPGYLRYSGFLRSRGYRPYQGLCRHALDLTRDDLLDGMSRSRRRAIERGREADVEVVEADVTRETLRRFHDTYEQVMERVGGTTHPASFFEHLAGMDERVLLVTAQVRGEYAGGFLELLDDEQSAIRGFVAAVPEAYHDSHAKERLYDYVFRWGVERGYDTYDFGSSRADFEDGVFQYKEGFGGRLEPTLVWERGGALWRLARYGRRKYLSRQR